MIEDATEIFDAALSLPADLRSELADRLLGSLSPPADDTDWAVEIRRRIDECRRDESCSSSFEDTIAEIRQRLDEKRRS